MTWESYRKGNTIAQTASRIMKSDIDIIERIRYDLQLEANYQERFRLREAIERRVRMFWPDNNHFGNLDSKCAAPNRAKKINTPS